MTHRIVVAGAGYVGLAAAMRLARQTARQDVSITLINAAPTFVERVRLHQLVAGTGTVERPLADILDGTGIQLRVGTITGFDRGVVRLVRKETIGDEMGFAGTVSDETIRKQVIRKQAIRNETISEEPIRDETESGENVSYDTLVYALGSGTGRVGVPGVAEHAYTVDGLVAANTLLAAIPGARRLVVCGGGLTGVEAATELAETYPGLSVTLVTRGELAYSVSPRGREHIRRVFDRLGIDVLEHTAVTAVTPTAVELASGRSLPADVTLWCGPFGVPGYAAEAGLATDAAGRALVDETLRSVSHPNVYPVGDVAGVAMPWGTPRMSCQAGLPMGLYAADAIAARLAGREPGPYRFRFAEQCISLGRRDGLIQLVRADDRPTRTVLTGRSAAVVKEYVCRGAAWAARTGMPSARLLYPTASAAGSGREWSTTSRETARVSTT